MWTRWYEQRLAGAPLGLPLERAWLELTNDDWNQGPAHANRRLKEIIDGQGEAGGDELNLLEFPEVPSQRPAAIEPVWQDSVLTLPKSPTVALSDDATLKAALRALKDNGSCLVKDAEAAAHTSNFDQRTVAYLGQVAESIPDEVPPQHVLFGIAHEHEVLVGLQGVVGAEWPSVLAARYQSFVLQFDRTIRQFPKWQEFMRNAFGERITPAQAEEVSTTADTVADVLASPEGREFIDRIIPERLQALVEWVRRVTASAAQIGEFVDKSKELLVQDLLESLNNVLKRIAEEVLPVVGAYADGARSGAVAQAGEFGGKDGRRLVKWARRLLLGVAAAGIGSLVTAFPHALSWYQVVVEFLRITL